MKIRDGSLLEKALWRTRPFLLARPVRRAPPGGGEGPLVVAGLFRTASGIGGAARGCADGLARHGAAPLCVDLSEAFGQADIEADRRLSPMPEAREGTLILHVNPPELARALFKLGLWRGRRWRIVGVWAWELERAPDAWLAAGARISELWAPSTFVAAAFEGRIKAPVKVVPPYAAPGEAVADRRRFELPEDGPVCLAMADGRSSFERKNILAAIRVFEAAATGRPDARLIVKTRNIGENPDYARRLDAAAAGDPRIRRIDASLSSGDQRALLASADIFLSLHRSEGFGLVIAEAMAAGKAVVATGWSGNMDFMAPDAAIAVPFSLVPVAAGESVYGRPGAEGRWAAPDEAAAAAALKALLDDPASRAGLGRRAREAAGRLDGRAILAALYGPSDAASRRASSAAASASPAPPSGA